MTPELARLVLLLEASVCGEDDFDRCVEQGHSLREAGEKFLHLSQLAFVKATAMVGAPLPMAVNRAVRPS